MQADVFQLIGYGSLVLLLCYVVYFIRRNQAKAPVPMKPDDMADAHLQALRENSELLKELIAVNRRLLQKQEQRDI
jgi:hypothetical protein